MPIGELSVAVFIVALVIAHEIYRRDTIVVGHGNLEFDRYNLALQNYGADGESGFEVSKPPFFDVGKAVCEYGLQARVINDEVPPETLSLVAGELNRVISVDEVAELKGNGRIGMRAIVFLCADFGKLIKVLLPLTVTRLFAVPGCPPQSSR